MTRSVPTFADADACLAAIRELRDRLSTAAGTTVRNGSGKWVWRISAEESDLAMSGVRYERRLRARLACQAQCAFFLAEQGTPGMIVAHGTTGRIFDAPADERTADYVQGRFG